MQSHPDIFNYVYHNRICPKRYARVVVFFDIRPYHCFGIGCEMNVLLLKATLLLFCVFSLQSIGLGELISMINNCY